MVRNKPKLYVVGERKQSDTRGNVEDELDTLFRLPLAEFTGARNTLAALLKKSGRGDESSRVKALGKPSISAWAVNQLYWNHPEAFNRLITSGEHFHKAQTSRLGAKLEDMRSALAARREALTHLSDLATSLLQDAGQSPSLDIIRRITTTLEGISAYASRSDGPRSGRLTHDVDPPGFDALGSFVAGTNKLGLAEPSGRLTPSKASRSVPNDARRTVSPEMNVRRLAETRKEIALAKVLLQEAKRVTSEASVRLQRLQAAQKKAEAAAKQADKQKRQAEERLKKARATSDEAAQGLRSMAVEVLEAARSLKDAERTLENASEKLDKLSRESRGR